MRLVRLDELSDEERKRALEEQQARINSNRIASDEIQRNVNQKFNDYVTKHGAYDTSKHNYSLSDIMRTMEESGASKDRIKQFKKANNVTLWDTIKETASNMTNGMMNFANNKYNNYNRIPVKRNNSGEIDKESIMLEMAKRNQETAERKDKIIQNRKTYNELENEQLKNSIIYQTMKKKNPSMNESELLEVTKEKQKEMSGNFIANLASMNPAKRSGNIHAITNGDKKEALRLQGEVQSVQAKEEANKINQDLKNGNYLSSIGHIVQGVPEGALNTSTKTIVGLASLLQEPTQISSNALTVDDYLDIVKRPTKYEEVTANIDNEVVKTGSGVSSTIGGMTPAILANLAMPGYGGIVNAINVGTSEYIGALNEDNSNKLQAITTGALKGTASYGIEKITGGNFLSKGSLDDIAKQTISSKFSSELSKKVASKIYEFGGEVLEENLENQVGYVIDKVINNKNITAEQWANDFAGTTKNTILTKTVLDLLGLGGDTYKEIVELEKDTQAKAMIKEAEKIIKKENLEITADKINEWKLRNVLNQVNTETDVKQKNYDNLQQNATQSQFNSPTQQITSQENKVPYNGNMEQTKNNIINEKVNQYIKENKNNFSTDINIDSKIIYKNSAPINYKIQSQGVIYNKARELFSSINKKVFKNRDQNIYVNNADIRESINNTLKEAEQKKHLNENLAVFSQLDKIIEKGKKISDSTIDRKGRDKYSNYEYYVSNAIIDGIPYVVEFDTRLQKGSSGKQERHFRLERIYNINEVALQTGTDNSMSQIVSNTTSINNSISQNTNSVKNDTITNNYMQNIDNNTQNNIPFRSSDEIANDIRINDLQAIKEENKKLDIPELDIVKKVENELRKNSVENSRTIDYIKRKRSKEKVSFTEIKDTLAQRFINKGHYIDKLANKIGNKNLTYLYDRTMNTFNESQISIGDYQINSKGDVVGKSIIDIFQPAEDMKISTEFEDYLLNKHNISRYAHEKGIFGKEISSTDSQNIVNKYEKQFPQFKEWAKEVSKYNDNNIRDLVDNGLVSEQTYNNLKQMYGDYVPTFRDITDNVSEYLDDRIGGNTIKKATESNLDILSVKESMAEQTLAIKKAIRINNLGVELYKTLGKDSTITTGIDFDAVAMQTIAGNVINSEGKGKNTFTIFQDGEMTQFKISDELYSAFSKDTLQNKINNSKVTKAILTPVEKMSKAQRELLTTYSVGFALNNPIKDFQDAMFNTKYSGGRFVKNWTKALYNIATDGSWYQSYKNNGGTANTYFDYNKGILPTNTKNPVKKFVNNIKNANNILEQAPRLAEYISTIETGGSIDEALYNSAEITTNFKRGGDVTKAVNKYGANFLNASVQGLDKLYRNISDQNGWKGYANLLTKATIYQIAPAIINGLLLGDDEDYEDLPEYTKDNYFLFKTGKGKFFRIPKGRISSVIGGLARRVLETVQGKEADWKYLIATTFNQLAPNNPFSDNIITPIKQTFDNKTWYGGEIVNSRLQKLPIVEQSDESTDKLSKFIGEKLKISPKKINYVIDQYSGGIGDILLPIMTPQAENNILEDKFTTDSVMKNKHVSEYYSKLDKYEKNKNSEKATDEDKLKYKYMMEVSKDLSDLYSKKRKIQNSNKSNKVKRDEIREIQAQINSIVEERLDTSNIVDKTDTTANIGESEYYKYKDEWTKLSDEEKEKNKQISLRTYADYRNKIYSKTQNKKNNGELSEKQELKNKDKVQILVDSNYSDKEKKELYKNYINSSDKKIALVEKLGLSINSYLDYKTHEFENDKDKDGKTISGTKKTKVLRYLNNISDRTLHREYKQIIYKIEGYNKYDKEIVNNIRSNKSLSFKEQNDILKIIGFKIDEEGNITTTTILPINKTIK